MSRILAWPARSAKLPEPRTPRERPDARERELLAALSAERLARAATAAAAEVGRPLHLVGGAVRDALLGRFAEDLDGVVEGEIDRLATALARRLGGRVVRLGGDRFAAVRVVCGAGHVDLWDRGGGPLVDDLRRRDLTVNAMALDPATGELIDPSGGLGDLRRRRLRATRPGVFAEDPLRVLRLARLRAELPGFDAVGPTRAAARRAAPGLAAIAAERIRDELLRLLSGPDAAGGLALLAGCAAETLFGARAGRAVAAGAARIARLDASLPRLADLGISPPPGQVASARLALLAEALAGAPAAGRRPLDELASRRWLPRSVAHEAARLLEEERLPQTERERRRFLHRAGPLWAAAAARFAALHEHWQEELGTLAALEARAGTDLRRRRPLLAGEEIARLVGCAPGPGLGRWVERLRRAEVDGEVESPEAARAWLADRAAGGAGS